jgi:hypothetical protein
LKRSPTGAVNVRDGAAGAATGVPGTWVAGG